MMDKSIKKVGYQEISLDGFETQVSANKELNNLVASVVLILVTDGADLDAIVAVRAVLRKAGITALLTAPSANLLRSAQECPIIIDKILPTEGSCLFDAIFIPEVKGVHHHRLNDETILFIKNAYQNGKVIATVDPEIILALQSSQTLALDNHKFFDAQIINYRENGDQFFKRFVNAITERNSLNVC